MSKWVIKGLQSGILTTRYPEKEENSPGVSPGFPKTGLQSKDTFEGLMENCPTAAFQQDSKGLHLNRSRCIHCFRCERNSEASIPWDDSFEWAKFTSTGTPFPKIFQKSLHIRVVDAGDCGACLNEVKLLNNPLYNIHRLGFFITPTPRQADILLVVGPVTDHMKIPLQKAYEAMPEPKRVMAVGACALSGGIFGPGFASGSGVRDILPVDIEVPGCPPPPLAVLHGLLTLAGRAKEIKGGMEV